MQWALLLQCRSRHGTHELMEQTADEARISLDFLLVLLLATKVSKRVDDDAKYQVQHYDDDDEEEHQIIDHACKE